MALQASVSFVPINQHGFAATIPVVAVPIPAGLAPFLPCHCRMCPYPYHIPTVLVPISFPVVQNFFLSQSTDHQLVFFSSKRMFAWHLSFTWRRIQLVHSLQCTVLQSSPESQFMWKQQSIHWRSWQLSTPFFQCRKVAITTVWPWMPWKFKIKQSVLVLPQQVFPFPQITVNLVPSAGMGTPHPLTVTMKSVPITGVTAGLPLSLSPCSSSHQYGPSSSSKMCLSTACLVMQLVESFCC